MCLSRDCQGRNPLHVAAMKGHVELQALENLVLHLNELLDEENDDGDTILHMAVRDRRIESKDNVQNA
ncbi:hypothetical protein BUALT_Bualt15G0072900 [Buddleja alternifolia]|uniref:Uncharacterized protein n=1 Tax=Buddleja alternifolia TaxID=168488 RepID=A0AAV6WP07_9LAMI|nr:hypothetical protein BUALT_Bualt15G0072900 [Buddleja alternifolia]